MKNYLKIMYVLCFSMLFIACSQEEENSTNEIQQKDIESILLDMKKVGDAEGKIVVFKLENFEKGNYIKNFELIENTKKVMAFAQGSNDLSKSPGDNYTVTCTWGNGDTKVSECGEDVGCAGAATWDCIDNGGCATICNAVITYTPSLNPNQAAKNNTSIRQLEAIFENVATIANSEKKSLAFTISLNNGVYQLKETSYIDSKSKITAKTLRTFVVYCYDSDGELLWDETYYDKRSASVGVLKCTDEDGGCAEICEIHAAYIYA
jgi:hypothetical protein